MKDEDFRVSLYLGQARKIRKVAKNYVMPNCGLKLQVRAWVRASSVMPSSLSTLVISLTVQATEDAAVVDAGVELDYDRTAEEGLEEVVRVLAGRHHVR